MQNTLERERERERRETKKKNMKLKSTNPDYIVYEDFGQQRTEDKESFYEIVFI